MQHNTLTANVMVDPIKNCIILQNENGFINEQVTVRNVFRAIRKHKLMSWKELANYLGIGKASSLFKIYVGRNRTTTAADAISRQLFISPDSTEVHLYASGFAPVNGEYPEYVQVVITNNEPPMTIPTKIPTRIFTRVSIDDPMDRCLTMRITPTHGYIVDDKSTRISTTGAVYTTTGRAKALTRMLHNLHYVGVAVGDASIEISINDNNNSIHSTVSEVVAVSTILPEVISTPSLTLGTTTDAALHTAEYHEGLITVADDDNKILGLRVTPFNCEVYGFTTTSHIYKQGEVYQLSGMPDYINEVVANLRITPLAEICHLGVELKSIDPTGGDVPWKAQEYLEIHAVAPSEPESEESLPEEEEEQPNEVPSPIYPDGLISDTTDEPDTEESDTEDEAPQAETATGVAPPTFGMVVTNEAEEGAPVADIDSPEEVAAKQALVSAWMVDNHVISNVGTSDVAATAGTIVESPEKVITASFPDVKAEALPITLNLGLTEDDVTQLSISTTGDNTITDWDLGVMEDGNFVLVQAFGEVPADVVKFVDPMDKTDLVIRITAVADAAAPIPDVTIVLGHDNKHMAYLPEELR